MRTAIRTTLTAVAGLVLSIGSLSVQAQPQPPHPHAPQVQQPPVVRPAVQPPAPAPQLHAPAPRAAQHHQPSAPAPQAKHGAGPDRQWVKGGKVPAHYRTQHYVVNDWKKHGLKQPPKGKQWIQHGADYLLIAKSNGLIAQVLHGR